jgi:uncharacterized membrane protein
MQQRVTARDESNMTDLVLNSSALPYPDPLHPVIVHFVIAMVAFSFVCDALGYFTSNSRLFEVSFWNMLVASTAVFFAVIAGQFEAGIAPTYSAVEAVLTHHQLLGWSMSALIVIATAWRFVLRSRSLFKISPAYLGVSAFLITLLGLQVYLGSQLVWQYGLHVKPVVQSIAQGKLS